MAIAPIFKKKYPITQKYGNKLIINGKEFYKQFWFASHMWVDFWTPVGTEILAWIDGQVEVVNDWSKGYGLHIKIIKQRPDWLTWLLYAHLSETFVKNGDTVTAWQSIGKTGNTGASTWPHLHLGLRLRNKEGKILNEDNGNKWWVDAMPYFQGNYFIA